MIICIEGINGSGKTTLARAIVRHWISDGGPGAEVIEPVQLTDFGRRLRSSIMDEASLDVVAETLAFASARLHACHEIRSITHKNPARLLILERWAGAVVAYGLASGMESILLEALERTLTVALHVDYTFLLDVPGELAAGRLLDEAQPNKFELRGADYLEGVSANYRSWAASRNIEVIDGWSGTADQHAMSILAIVRGNQRDCVQEPGVWT